MTLADGTAIELSRLGAMRTQLLAELREGRAAAAAQASGARGQGGDLSAQRSVTSPSKSTSIEDALLVVADGAAERIGFSFVTGVVHGETTRSTVALSGGSPLRHLPARQADRGARRAA